MDKIPKDFTPIKDTYYAAVKHYFSWNRKDTDSAALTSPPPPIFNNFTGIIFPGGVMDSKCRTLRFCQILPFVAVGAFVFLQIFLGGGVVSVAEDGWDRLARPKTAIQFDPIWLMYWRRVSMRITAAVSNCVAKMTQFVLNMMSFYRN